MDRDMRRLDVLRTAHRRTLHAIMPDHIAHTLQNSCDSIVNNANSLSGRTLHRQNNVPSSTQPTLLTINVSIIKYINVYVHCTLLKFSVFCFNLLNRTHVENRSRPIYHCHYTIVATGP